MAAKKKSRHREEKYHGAKHEAREYGMMKPRKTSKATKKK